jgi:hypothetical protein
VLLLCCLWVLSVECVGEAGQAVLLEVAPLLPISMWMSRSCKSRSGIAARALHQASHHHTLDAAHDIHLTKALQSNPSMDTRSSRAPLMCVLTSSLPRQ